MNGGSRTWAGADTRAAAGMILTVITVVALWGGLVYKLTSDWSTNAQYEFGYFVPFFIAYLLARRWQDRPEAVGDFPKVAILVCGAFGLLLLLPIRLIEAANADWRPLNWVWAGDLVLLTLLCAAYMGGWGWLRHFSLPLTLIFFALSWPLALEQSVIQGLARLVAKVTVELLSWIDIAALQHGNVIELAKGREIGVADACSGVRSIAGTLMTSVFLGEFYRLPWIKRVVLIAGGVCFALLLNLCRALFLSWQAATSGLQAISRWHDPAGFLIFAIAFLGLWCFAARMGDREPAVSRVASNGGTAGIPRAAAGAILAWLVMIEVINESWYHSRETPQTSAVTWEPRWPQEGESFHFREVPDDARAVLRYNEGVSAEMGWPDGSTWMMFFFRWRPGRTSSQLAVMHRPEICLPAAGLVLLDDPGEVPINVRGITLPFRISVFDGNGTRFYVYRCLWENGSAVGSAGGALDLSISGRLMAVWRGRRNPGQTLLQVSITGTADEQEAEQQLKERLPSLIVVSGQTAGEGGFWKD